MRKRSKHLKNELLLNEGMVSQYMNFVVKGCLRIFFIKEDDKNDKTYQQQDQCCGNNNECSYFGIF